MAFQSSLVATGCSALLKTFRGSRRKLLTALAVLILTGMCFTIGRGPVEEHAVDTRHAAAETPPAPKVQHAAETQLSVDTEEARIVGPEAHLALKPGQPPGERFRDSLRSDKRYITSFPVWGFNNQVINALNLLHLAFLLQQHPYPSPHVVILPPVTPHEGHLEAEGKSVAPYPLGRIFDLPSFEMTTGIGVVELRDVKDLEAARRPHAPKEQIACWSPWTTWYGYVNAGEYQFGLQSVSTPLPPSVMSPQKSGPWPAHIILQNLAALLSPPNNPGRRDFLNGASGDADRVMAQIGRGNDSWRDVWGSDVVGWREPEGVDKGSLVCLDGMYFSSERGEEVRELYEGRSSAGDYGPWGAVGRHLRWHPELEAQAKNVVRTVLGLPARAALPFLYTVHIRRTDFVPMCGSDACLEVSQYEDKLREVQEQLMFAGNDDAATWPVIVTTDEADVAYLADIKAAGWHLVDHHTLNTKETMGDWGPTLVDVVLLSLGKGFIGTGGSTMSILATRRVKDWNDGVAAVVYP